MRSKWFQSSIFFYIWIWRVFLTISEMQTIRKKRAKFKFKQLISLKRSFFIELCSRNQQITPEWLKKYSVIYLDVMWSETQYSHIGIFSLSKKKEKKSFPGLTLYLKPIRLTYGDPGALVASIFLLNWFFPCSFHSIN